MARPSIVNDALTEKFCSELRLSGSIESAIKATGIGRVSYYRWAREVRQRRANKEKVKFMRAVEKAEAEIKLWYEYQLSKYFDTHWRALAWWLERKYYKEYGPPRRMPPLDPDALDPYAPAEQPPPKVKPVSATSKPAEVLDDGVSEQVEHISDALGTVTHCERDNITV